MMSVPTEALGPPRQFSISTPGNWLKIDFSRISEPGQVADMVDAKLAERPDMLASRDELVEQFTRAAEGIALARPEFAATTVEVDGNRMVAATLTISLASVEDLPATPQVLVEQAQTQVRGLESAEVVNLPAGPSVRIQSIDKLDLVPGAPTVGTLTVQYLLIVPETTLMAVLTFTTPTVGFRAQLTELFTKMAESFEFVRAAPGE